MADEVANADQADAKVETPAKVEAPNPAQGGPETVSISRQEIESLRTKLSAFEKAEKDKADEARRLSEEKAREKGDLDKIITAREMTIAEKDQIIAAKDRKVAEVEARSRNAIIDLTITQALPVADLVSPSAAKQLLSLIRADFEAKPSGESWSVFATDGKSVDEAIKARLALPEFAHFLKATARPGAGAAAGGQGSIPTQLPDGKQQSYGDYLVAANMNRNVGGPAFSGKYKQN